MISSAKICSKCGSESLPDLTGYGPLEKNKDRILRPERKKYVLFF